MSAFKDSKLIRAPGVLKARFLRKPIGKKFAACSGKELRPKKWVFIVGCYNSGTTLLERILTKHPDIGGLPYEGVSLTDGLPQPEHFGLPRMWHLCEDRMQIKDADSAAVAQRVKRQWSWSYPSRSSVLAEKSIANACRIPFLEKEFDPAYFIHIVRNGYAVAEGIRRKGRPSKWGNLDYPDGYSIEMCARQWAESCRVISESVGESTRFHEIGYESLCEDPQGTIEGVLGFLGLSPDPVDRMIIPQRVHGETRPIRNMNPRSIESLATQEREVVRSTAGPWLDRFGYAEQVGG